MLIIAACIKCGTEMTIECDGEDEQAALAKAVELVESGLGEQSDSILSSGKRGRRYVISATLIPYYAKDENSSEEYSLRDLFGSAYSGGGFTFNEDGTFIDGITSASANSGAYIVEGDSVVITYSNDKNVIAAVTEWNGDVPAEITVNYGGIIVSFK